MANAGLDEAERTVGILFNPTNGGKLVELAELLAAAEVLKIAVEPLEVRSTVDLERAIARCIQLRCEALVTLRQWGA